MGLKISCCDRNHLDDYADQKDGTLGNDLQMSNPNGKNITTLKKANTRKLAGNMNFQAVGAAPTAKDKTTFDQNSSISKNNSAVPRLNNGELSSRQQS